MIDNSFEKDVDQFKIKSELTKEILQDKDIENVQKLPEKEIINLLEYDNNVNVIVDIENSAENKYIENMKNLEKISLLKEKRNKEKLSISAIKNNVESVYKEMMKEKIKYNLHKRKKKSVKNTKN